MTRDFIIFSEYRSILDIINFKNLKPIQPILEIK